MSDDDADFFSEVVRCLRAVNNTLVEANDVMLNETREMSVAQYTEIRLLMRETIREYRILRVLGRTFAQVSRMTAFGANFLEDNI